MNRDDIIRMLTEVGLWQILEIRALLPYLERFAALVAAEKDKEIAALKEERHRDMAEICSLRESEESLREEVERLREDNEWLRGLLTESAAIDPDCGCIGCLEKRYELKDRIDAALRREEQ